MPLLPDKGHMDKARRDLPAGMVQHPVKQGVAYEFARIVGHLARDADGAERFEDRFQGQRGIQGGGAALPDRELPGLESRVIGNPGVHDILRGGFGCNGAAAGSLAEHQDRVGSEDIVRIYGKRRSAFKIDRKQCFPDPVAADCLRQLVQDHFGRVHGFPAERLKGCDEDDFLVVQAHSGHLLGYLQVIWNKCRSGLPADKLPGSEDPDTGSPFPPPRGCRTGRTGW